jgi:hypothetical protein
MRGRLGRGRHPRRHRVQVRGGNEYSEQNQTPAKPTARWTIQHWRRIGLLKAHAYNDKQYLYEPVGTNPPRKQQGIKRTDLKRFQTASIEKTKEVQDEA